MASFEFRAENGAVKVGTRVLRQHGRVTFGKYVATIHQLLVHQWGCSFRIQVADSKFTFDIRYEEDGGVSLCFADLPIWLWEACHGDFLDFITPDEFFFAVEDTLDHYFNREE